MDTMTYENNVSGQLADRDIYLPLEVTPTLCVQTRIRDIVKRIKRAAHSGIDSDTHSYLINEQPIIPVLYMLPKIKKKAPLTLHYTLLCLPWILSLPRLIVRTQSYIKDTGNFLEKIRGLSVIPDAI